MCKERYCSESGNYDIKECPDAQKAQEELEKASDFYKEILDICYSEDKQDFCILEHCLIELAEILHVRFPNNKNLNVSAKC